MRQLSALSESGSDVTEAPPEATLVEIMEVEVPVELGRSLVDGVDDHGPSAELTPAAYTASQRVYQQMAAQESALFVAVDRQASQQHHGHRVGHSAPKARRRPGVSDRAH